MSNNTEAIGVSVKHPPDLSRKAGKGEMSTGIESGKPVSPPPCL
jgi:hypothetical protein